MTFHNNDTIILLLFQNFGLLYIVSGPVAVLYFKIIAVVIF